MHGHKRTEYKQRFQDPQVAAGLAQKAQQWYTLSDKVLELRREDPTTTSSSTNTSLPLLDKMLRVNPDPLHLWNIRRTILLQQQQQRDAGDWLPGELSLTAAALEKNPKAYGAWFHRKWVLQQQQQQQLKQPTTTTTTMMTKTLQHELALTDLFLQRDERNFHCWNFRRFVVGLELQLHSTTAESDSGGTTTGDGSWIVRAWNKDTTDNNNNSNKVSDVIIIGPQIKTTTCRHRVTPSEEEEAPPGNEATITTSNNIILPESSSINVILQREWDFTQNKIVSNFSNFSAFHYRSKLLLLAHLVVDTNNDNDNDQEKSKAAGWSPRNAFNSYSRSIQTMALQEWSLMENIMFTEPDDQTIWWYHRFLLDFVHDHNQGMIHTSNKSSVVVDQSPPEQTKNNNDSWYREWLQRQAEALRVLVEEDHESGCKWGLLGWHLVLSRLVAISSLSKEEEEASAIMEYKEQMTEILDKLIQVDPDRTQRYTIMKKQLLSQHITFS
jgi:Protein prenyltransferase alpha subunit repeat